MKVPTTFTILTLLAASPGTAQHTATTGLTASNAAHSIVPAGKASVVLDVIVDPPGTTRNRLHIIVSHPGFASGSQVSLIQPDKTEVNAGNAASMGYEWVSHVAQGASQIPTPMDLPGTHSLITLPLKAPGGVYRVRANASQVPVPGEMIVLYFSGNNIRSGILTSAPAYKAGEQVIVTVPVFQGKTPLTGVTGTVSLRAYIDVSHQASAQNIQLESRTPGDSDFLVEVYRADIVNAGAGLERVSATIRGTPEHVLVVDGSLAFGDVPAHTTRPGKNTFKIERKASLPFDVSSLQWRIQSHKTQGQVRLSDAGPKDAKTGDGLYTAAFTPAVPGLYTATAKVHGTAGGNAFARSSMTDFQVNPPTASFISF